MRLNSRIKTILFFFLLIVPVFYASAQKTFKYQATISNIYPSGFYRVNLLPPIMAKTRWDIADVRLVDQGGNFVPYITANNLPQVERQQFNVFPQVFIKPAAADTGTTFIAENKAKQPVSTLWVRLKNTAVKRTVNISGSDDQKTWYAIEENVPLQPAVSNSDGSYLQSLSFPPSNLQETVKQGHPVIIWISIAIALIILSLLTWKMMGEVGKKDETGEL